MKTSGADGSLAAMLSIFAASSAAASCLASDADFGSCASAPADNDTAKTPATHPRATALMVRLLRPRGVRLFYHSAGGSRKLSPGRHLILTHRNAPPHS